LFQQRSFDPGLGTDGMYVPRVVHYMSTIIAIKMFITGVIVLLAQRVDEVPPCLDQAHNGTMTSNYAVQIDARAFAGGLALMCFAFILWSCSFHSYLTKMLAASLPNDDRHGKSRTTFEKLTRGLVRNLNVLLQDVPNYNFSYSYEQHEKDLLPRKLKSLLEQFPGSARRGTDHSCLSIRDAQGRSVELDDVPSPNSDMAKKQFPMHVSISQIAWLDEDLFQKADDGQDELRTPLLSSPSAMTTEELHWDARRHLQMLKTRTLPANDAKAIKGYIELKEKLDQQLDELFAGPPPVEIIVEEKQTRRRMSALPAVGTRQHLAMSARRRGLSASCHEVGRSRSQSQHSESPTSVQSQKVNLGHSTAARLDSFSDTEDTNSEISEHQLSPGIRSSPVTEFAQ